MGCCFSDAVPVVNGNSSGSAGERGSPVGADRVMAGAPLGLGGYVGFASLVFAFAARGLRSEEPRSGKRERAVSADRVDLSLLEDPSLRAEELGRGPEAMGRVPDADVSPISGAAWRNRF